MADKLLLESGDILLLESGDGVLLEQRDTVKIVAYTTPPNPSGISLFIGGQLERKLAPLYINSRGFATASTSGIPLFVDAATTGIINDSVTLYTPGRNIKLNKIMPLFISNNVASGSFTLSIPGGSELEPKEWFIYRRAGVDSSGFFTTGDGITIFINGS